MARGPIDNPESSYSLPRPVQLLRQLVPFAARPAEHDGTVRGRQGLHPRDRATSGPMLSSAAAASASASFTRRAARTRTSSRVPAPIRAGSGCPSAAGSRGRCRGRARCRRRRARGSDRGDRTSRRSARARRRGCRAPRRGRRSAPGRRAARARARPAAVRRVLDGVLDEVDEHLAEPVGIGGDRRQPARGATSFSSVSAGACVSAAARTPRAISAASRPADRDARHARVEPAREQDVVDDPGEPLRLARDDPEHPARAGSR